MANFVDVPADVAVAGNGCQWVYRREGQCTCAQYDRQEDLACCVRIAIHENGGAARRYASRLREAARLCEAQSGHLEGPKLQRETGAVQATA